MTFNPAQEKFPLRQKSWLQKIKFAGAECAKGSHGRT